MLSYCTNYAAQMPDITVYMNCDTRLAINLSMFELGEFDEFVFTIKNYDYVDSSYVFLFKARKSDIDENGEVIFNIDPDISKNIKPGAFYTFAFLVNSLNPNKPVEYIRLPENGRINIEYGAYDFALAPPEETTQLFNEINAVRLERIDEAEPCSSYTNGTIVSIRLERLDQ